MLLRIALCIPALALPLLCLAQSTPADYRDQLACVSPQTRALLDAPVKPDPRDNVWVLEVLHSMGVNRVCNDLDANRYARFLERQAVNDILQEPVPLPANVREANAWERQVEDDYRADRHDGVTVNLDRLHDRMLTRAFAVGAWTPRPDAAELLRAAPGLQMTLPGVWLAPQTEQPGAGGPLLSLTFTNRAARPVNWDAQYLVIRHAAESPFDRMFNCRVDGRNIAPRLVRLDPVAPGGEVHVVCFSASTGWDVREIDAAWMERFLHGETQWLLQGPAPEDGIYKYQDTISRYSTPQSRDASSAVVRTLSCNQFSPCISLKADVMTSPAWQLATVGLPSALVGALLVTVGSWGRRARMLRVARFLIVATLIAAAAALAVLSMSGSRLGMGAVALFFFTATVAAGLIVGMLSLGWWGAWRARRSEAG